MRFVAALALLVACASLRPPLVLAQTRAGRALAVFGERPALFLAPERAIAPGDDGSSLSVCSTETGRCSPVRERRRCDPPRCASPVTELVLESGVVDVSDVPSSGDGRRSAYLAALADPQSSALASYLTPGPPSPPPTFFLRNGEARIEASVGLGAAVDAQLGVVGLVGSASIGVRLGYDWDHEDVLDVLFGVVHGLDLRFRTLATRDARALGPTTVTLGLASTIAERDVPFRVPALYTSLFPELGVAFDSERSPALYVGWQLPVSLAVDTHLAIELRTWVGFVDDWIAGDDVAWLGGVELAGAVF